jgi:hypothetical protein
MTASMQEKIDSECSRENWQQEAQEKIDRKNLQQVQERIHSKAEE